VSTFEFSAQLWQYPGESGWHFISVPADISDDIAHLTAGNRHGFGSVRVTATIGGTTWQTSVFPDSKSGTYLLPVKKPVRKAEQLTAGAAVETRLELAEL
jgi:uncharacterized protein DUF1905